MKRDACVWSVCVCGGGGYNINLFFGDSDIFGKELSFFLGGVKIYFENVEKLSKVDEKFQEG